MTSEDRTVSVAGRRVLSRPQQNRVSKVTTIRRSGEQSKGMNVGEYIEIQISSDKKEEINSPVSILDQGRNTFHAQEDTAVNFDDGEDQTDLDGIDTDVISLLHRNVNVDDGDDGEDGDVIDDIDEIGEMEMKTSTGKPVDDLLCIEKELEMM